MKISYEKYFLFNYLFTLAGCSNNTKNIEETTEENTSSDNGSEMTSASSEDQNLGEAENRSIEIVKNYLKDPDSAKFRNVKNNCGEVNATNSFGAYEGYNGFVIWEAEGKTYVNFSSTTNNFNLFVRDFCK